MFYAMEYDLFAIKVEINFLAKAFPGNWNYGRRFPWTWISLFAIRINNSLSFHGALKM